MARESRRERERKRHRAEILEAAHKLVADHGHAAVTVERVAREADFAVGSIYRHFPSKEALFDEVLRDVFEAQTAALEAMVNADEGTFEEQLLRLVTATFDSHFRNRPIHQALLELPGPIPGPDSAAGRAWTAFRLRWHGAATQVLDRGQRAGQISPGDLTVRAHGLHASIIGFLRASLFGTVIDDTPGVIVRLFLGGARSPGW